MIKKFLALISLVVILVSSAFAITTAVSSGVLSSSAIVHTGRCYLTHVLIGTDGSNDATITLYDGTSTAGVQIGPPIWVPGGVKQGSQTWTIPKLCNKGIYVSISGTNATADVEFILE